MIKYTEDMPTSQHVYMRGRKSYLSIWRIGVKDNVRTSALAEIASFVSFL